jgi:acetyl esterase/lipase
MGWRKYASLKNVPSNIVSVLDEVYGPNSADERLDVFCPQGTSERLPTIVWVHGGAFISGTKNAVRNYLKILASHGYTVVNVEYSPAPEQQCPTPVKPLAKRLRD